LAIKTFDHAWANLEHKYIEELIQIENQARSMVVEAIMLEKQLSSLEEQIVDSGNHRPSEQACEKARQDLVQSFGQLNAVANHRRKGRDDLKADILEAAMRAKAERKDNGDDKDTFDAAGLLADDVLKSFEALRVYLRQVEQCLECIDPHLCNNSGLVDRLVDWEESWEIGNRYLKSEGTLDTLCDLVDSIQRLQALEPTLGSMCEDCDVQLFLVLPRLLVLRYLVVPEQQTDLLQSLLPHRFQPASESCPAQAGVELAELASSFAQTRQAATDQHEVVDNSASTWHFFARSALGTPGEAAPGAMEAFMRELESWSVEVQRYCADDWNQCCAVLVQCLSNSVREQRLRSVANFDV